MEGKKKILIITLILIISTIAVFIWVKKHPIVSELQYPKLKLIKENLKYDSSDKYYDFVEEELTQYEEIVLDENGIRQSLLDAENDTYTYNMATIVKYGLAMFGAYYEYEDIQYYENAKIQADALVKFQDKETGMFYNNYKVTLSQADETVTGKWGTSAIQGQSISLLSRMYVKTGDIKYKEACELALKAFEIETYNGGIVSYLDGNIFYDGYNLDYGIYNLSFFMDSLIGLYDCYKNLDNSHAKELYDIGISTLKKCIQYYDKEQYTLMDLSNKEVETKSSKKEHINQILQLQIINQIENDIQFENVINKWKKYVGG